MAGASAHSEHREERCDPCRRAFAEYSKRKARESAEAPKIKYKKDFPAGQACRRESSYYPKGKKGTRAGYNSHRKAGEDPCQECKEGAKKEARAKYRESRPWLNIDPSKYDLACEVPKKSTPKGRRGTTAGFSNHKTAREAPCQECLEAEREKNREYTNSNYHKYRDRKIKYQEEYREKNRKKIRDRDREYYNQNKIAFRDRKEERNNMLLSLPSDGYNLGDIAKTHGTVCHLCLTEVDPDGEPYREDSPHIDHVHPISDPDCPGDILDNVRWTHARCNLRKGSKKMEDLDLPFNPPSDNLVEY